MPETNELLAAVDAFMVKQREFELRQKALKEAEEALYLFRFPQEALRFPQEFFLRYYVFSS